MNNILKIVIKNGDSIIAMHKDVDFIPSKGLMIEEPIKAVIHQVLYDKNGYTSFLQDYMEPTNPEDQIAYLKSIGFTETNL